MESGWLVNSSLSKSELSAAAPPGRSYQNSPIASPLWRALLRYQHESPELAYRLDRMRDAIVARLELMYRPELSTLPGAERKAVLITLEALTDFESWGRLRERHGLSIEAARDIWIAAINRILPPTPSES